MVRINFYPIIISFSLIAGHVSGQTAQPDPAIRVTLERAYENWRAAMAEGDMQKWENATAYSRQLETRNRMLSQRLPFPQALWENPLESPTLGGLTPLGVLSTGTTATSSYFGRIRLGNADGAEARDNILVLHFLKEEDHWKFDNLRIVQIQADGELLLQIRNADFSFLQGKEFQPAPQLPPIPQPVDMPEYVAEAWINSTGCEVTITVNGHLTGKFPNTRTAELVMGGLHRGQNEISMQIRKLPESQAAPDIEVAIYATKDPDAPANRVFHYKPGADFTASVVQKFAVE